MITRRLGRSPDFEGAADFELFVNFVLKLFEGADFGFFVNFFFTFLKVRTVVFCQFFPLTF